MLTSLKRKISIALEGIVGISAQEIASLLEVPKEIDHGHLALPTFFLAKKLRQAPPKIALELSDQIRSANLEGLEKVEPVGGYINVFFQNHFLQELLTQSIFSSVEPVGFNKSQSGKKVVIDYSSPNVAKRMSIGHLRATVIGQAIANLARSQGLEVIGLNHLGDWGTQFGKLAWAIDKWGDSVDFSEAPLDALTTLYVRFHDEAEKDPKIEEGGAEYFRKLEAGDPHLLDLWRKIVDISMAEYSKYFELLGVKHDLVRGESFYNDRLRPTEDLIEKKGLLVESDGAMVVELEGNRPPCLIRKSDGASLYATRDIASAIYRMEELGADENLYVVGQDQTLHFQQVFEVLEKMNFPWAKNCHHISFGMYKFKDKGRMSTRKGTVIHLEDVVDKSIELVSKIVEDKNPDLKNKDEVARQVGVGAVIFNDLMNDRIKNVDFDWERILNFDGDSGPYVQYCVVRCRSLLRKFHKPVDPHISLTLESEEERKLVKILIGFDEVLTKAYRAYKPHFVANYLIDVCQAFGQFYHKCRIIGESESVEKSRITLVACVEKVLVQGLSILNIQAPEEM